MGELPVEQKENIISLNENIINHKECHEPVW